jgi:hypothetical protein
MERNPISSGFTRLGANWTSRHPDQLKSDPCVKKLESGQSLRRLCLSFPHDKHGSIRSEFLSESRVCSPVPASSSPRKGRKTPTKLPASSALSSRGTSSGGPGFESLESLLQSQLLRTRLKVVHSLLKKPVRNPKNRRKHTVFRSLLQVFRGMLERPEKSAVRYRARFAEANPGKETP